MVEITSNISAAKFKIQRLYISLPLPFKSRSIEKDDH
jgi:hypothetical protein